MIDSTDGFEDDSTRGTGDQQKKSFEKEERLLLALSHPLMMKGCTLPTEPAKELVLGARRAVMLREQGCCFTATSGYGKTYGLSLAETELRRYFPSVPIYRHTIESQQQPSIRAFFKHFLITVGEDNTRGETPDLRLRMRNRLLEKGLASKFKLIVFLIDEAQEMALQDFLFLKDIGNTLEEHGVQLVVIMMGQEPDFSRVIRTLRNAGRLDLISRFTLRQMRFRGLSTRKDFENLLGQIDAQTYPEGSNCTWTEFFVPRAWAKGFRMKDQTDPLIKALKRALPDGEMAQGVSARQLFLAIRKFMVDIADLELKGKNFPDGLWKSAVQYALIVEASTIAAEDMQKGKKRGSKDDWEAKP